MMATPTSPFFASSPSLNKGLISVGSVNNIEFPLKYSANDTAGQTLSYFTLYPFEDRQDGYSVAYADLDQCSTEEWWDAAVKEHEDLSSTVFGAILA